MPARPKNNAIVYLRRSSNRQEISLPSQLGWALEEAPKHGLRLDATIDDLAHMQHLGLHSFKSIRLDDAITGANMKRPGFLAVLNDVGADRLISHVLVHRRDRLARPSDAMQMANTELSVRRQGVTFVFSNTTAGPMEWGDVSLQDELVLHIEYFQNGEFLRQLAERVINALRIIALDGYWTGGQAPYGFVRILVDAQGNEIMELPPGRRVREQGCHVQIKPVDTSKIMVWLQMLELKYQGWGYKRIATYFNQLGVPSPHAGRTRRDHGIKHVVSGKWCAGSVKAIVENSAIISIQNFGRRSEGAHRRLSETGYRTLTEHDFSEPERVRIIRNPANIIIPIRMAYEPLFDVDKWEEIQAKTRARGTSQLGIPRVRDLSKYPLSCRVIDMTDDCGATMHGRTHGKRRLYVCGRYINSGSKECKNNSVDAEALLKLILDRLARISRQPGSRQQLREHLRTIAESRTVNYGDSEERMLDEFIGRRSIVAQDYEVVGSNMAKERDDGRRDFIGRTFDRLGEELKSLDEQIAILRNKRAPINSVDQEVERALAIFDEIELIVSDPSARARILNLVQRMGIWIGLNFEGQLKGKKRQVRRMTGGVVTFGDTPLPVPLHGRDRVADTSTERLPCKRPAIAGGHQKQLLRLESPGATYGPGDGAKASPLGPPGATNDHQEGVSSSKDNRGDRRWTFPNEPVNTRLLWCALAQTIEFSADTFFAQGG